MIGILKTKKRDSKKAWIRIVEAFIALLLITGTLLVVIDRGYIGRTDIAPQVYTAQVAILREIELNSDYRSAIINQGIETPINWDEFEDKGLEEVQEKINQSIPDYLECVAKICKLEDICSLVRIEDIEKDIYAQAVAIAAEKDVYEPRQLKLFCWTAG